MGNLAKGIKDTLPEFQKYLLERSLAPEKNAPFLAYWVSRFLSLAWSSPWFDLKSALPLAAADAG